MGLQVKLGSYLAKLPRKKYVGSEWFFGRLLFEKTSEDLRILNTVHQVKKIELNRYLQKGKLILSLPLSRRYPNPWQHSFIFWQSSRNLTKHWKKFRLGFAMAPLERKKREIFSLSSHFSSKVFSLLQTFEDLSDRKKETFTNPLDTKMCAKRKKG